MYMYMYLYLYLYLYLSLVVHRARTHKSSCALRATVKRAISTWQRALQGALS